MSGISRKSRKSKGAGGRFTRIRRRLFIAVLVLLLLPFPIVLLLNVVQPPTTAVILETFVGRLFSASRPAYPRRQVVSRDRISPALRRAVLASEDERFYRHHGFDFEEINRAIARKRAGHRLRGASTLSQQTAKNLFLWNGHSFVRKGLEAYLTLVLELCVPKDRILDLYLNLAEWGDGVFGAEMAARKQFGKSAASLTASEAARLAAILPNPRRWPANGSVAQRRSGVILQRMSYRVPR